MADLDVQLVGSLADNSSMPNLWGVRVGTSLFQASKVNNKLSHEINFSVALISGESDCAWTYQDYPGNKNIDAFHIPVLLGYNVHYAINDKWGVFVGAKAGLTYMEADVSYSVSYAGYSQSKSATDKAGNFTMAIGLGTQYAINDKVSIKLGYEYTNNTIIVDGSGTGSDMSYSVTDDMTNYHTLYFGAVINF